MARELFSLPATLGGETNFRTKAEYIIWPSTKNAANNYASTFILWWKITIHFIFLLQFT